MFKLKKHDIEIGGFSLSNAPEWTCLIKSEIKDFNKFLHIRKTMAKGSTEESHIEIFYGYIKDSTFVVSSNKQETGHTVKIDSLYKSKLEEFGTIKGFYKDGNMYLNNGDCVRPNYYKLDEDEDEDLTSTEDEPEKDLSKIHKIFSGILRKKSTPESI